MGVFLSMFSIICWWWSLAASILISKMDWFFFKLFNNEDAVGDDKISILMLSFSFVVVDVLLELFVSSVLIFCGMLADWGIAVDDEVSCLFCKVLDEVVFVILLFSALVAKPKIIVFISMIIYMISKCYLYINDIFRDFELC